MGVPRIMPNWTILALKIETHGDLGIPHSKNPPIWRSSCNVRGTGLLSKSILLTPQREHKNCSLPCLDTAGDPEFFMSTSLLLGRSLFSLLGYHIDIYPHIYIYIQI